MTKRKAKESESIDRLLHRIFPDGVVEMPFSPEESYFWKIEPRLIRALERIKGVGVFFDRNRDGEATYSIQSTTALLETASMVDVREAGDSWPDDDSEPVDQESYSYHLFFLGLEDEKFTFSMRKEVRSIWSSISGSSWGPKPVGHSVRSGRRSVKP